MITKIGRMFVLVALAALLLISAPSSSLRAAPRSDGQQTLRKDYALIFGTVWGADERPVYGVPVKIRRADQKKAKWQIVSDHNGEFAQRVPAGKADYIVWADIKMPKGKPQPQATVHVEFDERIDMSLHLTE